MPEDKEKREKIGDQIYSVKKNEAGTTTSVAATSGGMHVGQGGSDEEMEKKYGAGSKDPSASGESMNKLGRAWAIWRKNNPSGGQKGSLQKKAVQ